MKKNLSIIGIILLVGCIMLTSCSEKEREIMPFLKTSLKDGGKIIDSINTILVAGTSVNQGELMLITGTGVELEEQKVLTYIKGQDDGEYIVKLDAETLLNFSLESINTSTVIYYVSKSEYYLLVDGKITVSGSKARIMNGAISGKMILLSNGISVETIEELLASNKSINGTYRCLTVKF